MSVPKPPTSLDNSCSVIHDNTLYSYSPQGFLSLPLEAGAKWNKLTMGEKVMGAACVGSTPVDPSQAGFFVVGGKSDSNDYTGLQKFTYSTGKWTTIKPTDLVTKNRQGHGATYIPADDAILIYAGSQDGVTGPSTQTFTIKASEPFDSHGFQSSAAPAVSPIVINWSNADAAMLTGDGADGKIYWFNPTAGWRYSGTSLTQPIQKASGSVNAVLVTGTDGSKSLYTFDLSKSPNAVSRVIVQDASGAPVANSAPISARSLDEDLITNEKRDLTLSNWPKYNSTLAPTVTRQNFAMAQGPNGMVVFSGGNANNPISVFDANRNGWVNATELLADPQLRILAVPSTTSQPTISISSTPGVSQTAACTPSDLPVPPIPTASGSGNSGLNSNAILGIALGSIAGFLILLGLILFLLRQRKRYQAHAEAGQATTDRGGLSDEKNNATFVSSPFPPVLPSHYRQTSQESTSSMAILMGRVGQDKSRRLSNDSHRTSTSSFQREFKGMISKPFPQAQDIPSLQAEDDKGVEFAPTVAESRPRDGPMETEDGTRRSSGWNRYWSGGSALQVLGFGSSKRNTVESERSSRYSQSSNDPGRDSVTVPPPSFEGRPEMSRVNSGSPVVSTYPTKIPWKDGMSGTIERPVSTVSSTGYSSGIPESIHDGWDPTEAGKSWGADRAPSSAYTTSQPTLGLSKQPQLAMASKSNDMSWLNLGDQSRV